MATEKGNVLHGRALRKGARRDRARKKLEEKMLKDSEFPKGCRGSVHWKGGVPNRKKEEKRGERMFIVKRRAKKNLGGGLRRSIRRTRGPRRDCPNKVGRNRGLLRWKTFRKNFGVGKESPLRHGRGEATWRIPMTLKKGTPSGRAPKKRSIRGKFTCKSGTERGTLKVKKIDGSIMPCEERS